MEVKINRNGKLVIHAKGNEDCCNCAHELKCPLLCSIHEEIVIPRFGGEFTPKCGLHEPVRLEVPNYTTYHKGEN